MLIHSKAVENIPDANRPELMDKKMSFHCIFTTKREERKTPVKPIKVIEIKRINKFLALFSFEMIYSTVCLDDLDF